MHNVVLLPPRPAPRQAEELIKAEMLVMLRSDLLAHPPPPSCGVVSKPALTKAKADLATQPLQSFSEEELEYVSGREQTLE